VTVRGSGVVYNAPIVATGDGPFDVTTHRNTHDRTLGIDTVRMTTDHLFIRGFANGQPILYLSFESSDAFTAALERSTFVPALADLAFANGGGNPKSARASIFTFVNSRTGLERNAPAAGASDGTGTGAGPHARDARRADQPGRRRGEPRGARGLPQGRGRQQHLRRLPHERPQTGPPRVQPGLGPAGRRLQQAGVARRLHGLKQDANVVRRMAAQGLVTSPGGTPLGSANVVINCPALGFLQSRPRARGPPSPA
jgi:hypothetical protein